MGLVLSKQSGAIGYLTMARRGVDPDAQAFINATSITGTNSLAISDLVDDLKIYSLWTKMRAVYPMIGGTATTHKFNLVNPADTNAAYRLSFVGGWTHLSTGALPNGSTAYANTFFVPSPTLTSLSCHLSFYSRTNVDSFTFDMGVRNSLAAGNPTFGLVGKFSNNMYTYANVNESTGRLLTANTNSSGLLCVARNGTTTVTNFRNGSSLGSAAIAELSVTTYNLVIGAQNDGGTITAHSTRECAFASIGDGLSNTDVSNLYTAVQKFQTTLGRQV